MNIGSSIARMQRGTAFLLALGLAAGSSGAWLLFTPPSGTTADALARVATRSAPVVRASEGWGFASALPVALPVAMLEGACGVATRAGTFGLAMREGALGRAAGEVVPGHAPGEAALGHVMHAGALDPVTHSDRAAYAAREAHADRTAVDVAGADVSVEVRAPVSGRVAAVRFEPGSYVEKGDTLFVLDRAPFVAAVERAQAEVTSARARLGSATAELGRAQRAFDDGAIGSGQLEAQVRLQREAHGALREAATELENARRDLGHTRVVAPIGGRVAGVGVAVGDRVAAAPEGGALLTIVSPATAYAADCGVRLAQAL